jgi:hypothetical protein
LTIENVNLIILGKYVYNFKQMSPFKGMYKCSLCVCQREKDFLGCENKWKVTPQLSYSGISIAQIFFQLKRRRTRKG